MDGQIKPAIGPTEEWWWQGSKSILPDFARASASWGVLAFPSNNNAPMTAPFIGPAILSQVIGGPACRNRFSRMPGITSMARASQPRLVGIIILSTHWVLAFSISIMFPPTIFHSLQNGHQALVSTGRRPPVYLDDRSGLGCQVLGKRFQPNVDAGSRALQGSQADPLQPSGNWPAVGWSRALRISPRSAPSYHCWSPPTRPRLSTAGSGFPGSGSSSVPVTTAATSSGARSFGRAPCLYNGGRQLARGIRMRAVPDDYVEHDHRLWGSAASSCRRRIRSSLSIMGCRRPTVNSSSPRSTILCAWLTSELGSLFSF